MKTPRLDGFIPKPIPTLSSPIDDYPPIEQPKPKVVAAAPAPEQQLAPLHEQVSSPASPSEKPPETPEMPLESQSKQTQAHSLPITYERTNERSNEVTNERTFERPKIRHSFDVYSDQLMSLREIALKREAMFGKRTLLGELVQEALDMFLTKERNKE